MPILIALILLAVLVMIMLLISYVCFRMAFYVSKTNRSKPLPLPNNKIYSVHKEQIKKWAEETKNLPSEEMSITSFDGLKLYGKFYEYSPDAPIELMFHGYRGSAERDLAGGVQRCFALQRSALIVDQRSGGKSEGNVITFGINEHRDCLAWVYFMLKRFGDDVKIILTGISMGGATVLMASDKDLPPNVIGVLADCGFTSAKEIIKKVIKDMGLPPTICYPFVKLGAKIYGKFDLEEGSAIEAVKNARVPVILFHGEDDDFVPCEMSRINYEACTSRKKLVTIPQAGHGLSYPVAPEKYLNELKDFF